MAVNESNTIQYIVTTTNTADGTTLYWKTTGNVSNSDIVGGNTGSITITNNQAIFNVTVANDVDTDGTKTLGISLSTGSLNGPIVVSTANPITINDTSLSPGPERLYAWGRNNAGELGLGSGGTYNTRSSPVQVGTNTNWNLISKSHYTSIATKTDGTLWAWGSNTNGRLGLNDTAYRSSPTQVGTNTNWNLINVGLYQIVATKTDGTLWMWGKNDSGQLGQNNNVNNRSSPVQVGSATNWSQIHVGGASTLAIKTDGTLWAWGWNGIGQLGLGNGNNYTSRSSPTQVGAGTNWSKIAMSEDNSTSVLATKTDGTLYAWGCNTWGRLGLNDQGFTAYRSSPTQVGSDTTWNSIGIKGHSMAIKTNGTLWLWGNAQYGQLGQNNNNINGRSSPVQLGATTNWSKISLDHDGASVAIKTDGTLWTWGKNTFGQLGLNSFGQYQFPNGNVNTVSSPTQVGANTNWSKITSGRHSTMAITSDPA
jgi:alpha-tubulin suppressor-like RCC1 family protein